MKRVCALMLAVALLLTNLPIKAFAEEEIQGNESQIVGDVNGSEGATHEPGVGSQVFYNFKELKDALSNPQYGYTYLFYMGESPLVVEEDIVISENYTLSFFGTNQGVTVPAGITFTCSGWIDIMGPLVVDGTINANYIRSSSAVIKGSAVIDKLHIEQSLEVTGSLSIYTYLEIYESTSIEGDENIAYKSPHTQLVVNYTVSDIIELGTVVRLAESELNPWKIYSVYSEEAFVISQSITLPKNLSLELRCDVSLSPGCTFVVNNYLSCNSMDVEGLLVNNGTICIGEQNSYHSHLKIAPGGFYSGAGQWEIYGKNQEEAIQGLSFNKFEVTEHRIDDSDFEPTYRWTLSPKVPSTMAELSEADYLAFAAIAYEDFRIGETIYECLLGLWDDFWSKEQQITYGELCANIECWKVCNIREDIGNGFYAVAFENNNNEIVLAYRGSENPLDIPNSEDAYNDWIRNDLPMILWNNIRGRNQYADALTIYAQVIHEKNPNKIVVTGHSLGGLWGDAVSAQTGCEGKTFNAISALDIIYTEYSDIMGKTFRGTDAWNFKDHANQYDAAAGMMEALFSAVGATRIKPYISYKSNYSMLNFAGNHSLDSMVHKLENGTLQMNEIAGNWSPTRGMSNHMNFAERTIDLGISGKDAFYGGLFSDEVRTSYGGDGDDDIKTSIRGDTIIGGNGNDILNGGWGNDTYIYHKGNGHDYIYDAAGKDTLLLEGFSSDDVIGVSENNASDYIDILCNGDVIVSVYKKNRDYTFVTLDSFRITVKDGMQFDITEYFHTMRYGSRILVACPVDVEILDAAGKVVFSLKDGEVGDFYTEYGNFHVFEEESGGYGKVLELIEGYTVQVVGQDEGTMDVTYYHISNGELSDPQTIENVTVSDGYVAKVEKNANGEIQITQSNEDILWGDPNGDGKANFKDAVLILQYASGRLGLDQIDLGVVDVNGDGRANFKDAVLILQKASGRIDKFPIEK